MLRQTSKNNEYLKVAKNVYNNGYYKLAEDLVNEKGEYFAEYAMETWLVNYPEISETDLSGLDLVQKLIDKGVSLQEANKKRLEVGMDEFIGYVKKL